VRHCPISSPLINRVMNALWEAGENEEVASAIREVQIFAADDDNRAFIEVYAARELSKQDFERITVAVRGRVPEIVGVIAVDELLVRRVLGHVRGPLFSAADGPPRFE
ncbi:MAG: hypothetical protein ACXWA3_10510, partial [Acidimicrobiales bacterium]